jgi:uncharacterized protein
MKKSSIQSPRRIALFAALACSLSFFACVSVPDGRAEVETEAEFARDLLVAIGLDPGPGLGSHWAEPYLSLLVYLGYADIDEFAKAEDPISRLEMARVLLRAANEGDVNALTAEPLAAAVAEGLILVGPGRDADSPVEKGETAAAIAVLREQLTCPKAPISKYKRIEIRDGGIVADFFHEPGATAQRLVVLLGGSEGGRSWSGPLDEKTRRDLLERHYAILSLGYFGEAGLPSTLEAVPLEYFEKAIDRGLSMPGVDPSGAAIIGVSKGGEAALLVASSFPEKVKAVVGIVPSSHVFQGIGPDFLPRKTGEERSSWSRNGADLAFAAFTYGKTLTAAERAFTEKGKLDWDDVYAEALGKADPSSAIPLEKADCPILLLSGGRDEMWPSSAMCDSLVLRLEAAGYGRHVEHLRFDQVGHDVLFAPGAWPQIVEFLEESFPVIGAPVHSVK